MSTSVLAAALEALDAGLSVIPIKADGTKRPALDSWKEYQTFAPARSTVDGWFNKHPEYGLAALAGEVSGNLEWVDLEVRELSVAVVEAATQLGLGDLVDRIRSGYEEHSPKGAHWVYRCPEIGGTTTLAQRIDPETDKPVVLFEIRGEGAYAVVAPSKGAVHDSGKPYERISGSFATIAVITPEERQALLSLLRSFDEVPPREDPPPGEPTAGEGERPGDAFRRTHGDLAGWRTILEPHGWTYCFTRADGTAYWRRPGKVEGWSATTGHAGTDFLYVFSTSTNFEAERGINPFTAYAILNHGGDFTAAAAALASEGYGTPRPNSTFWSPSGSAAAGDIDPPVLDEHALYGLAGDVVRAFDPLTEADPAAVLVSYLVAFGNATNRSPHTFVGDKRHGLNLFAVICGKTARSRKGTSWSLIERIFKEADKHWIEERSISGIGSGEGIVWHIRDASEPKLSKSSLQATVEDPGVSDKRLFIQEEELSALLKVAGRQGSIASETARKAWDAPDVLHNAVKGKPVRATKPHISLLGHITVEELRRTLTETEQANGFENRVLWVYARRSKHVASPPRLDDATAAGLIRRTRDALDFARRAGSIHRDAEAEAMWVAMYPELTKDQPGLFGLMISRAEAQVVRLSMIYALLDSSNVVRPEHLVAAAAFWQYCEDSVRYIFGDALGDPVADKILNAIRAHGEMSETELHALFSNNLKGAQISLATARLLELGLVKLEERETGGKRARYWKDARG